MKKPTLTPRRLFLFFLIVGLVSLLVWQIIRYLMREPITPRIEGYAVHGIDVSHHQQNIDWAAVRLDSIHFVLMKASEGENFLDPQFRKNWRAARQQGLVRGAYHFYRPSVLAEVQARQFIKVVQLENGDLPPVLDLEVTDNRPKHIILKGAKIWLRLIERHYGVKPIIYVNQHWYYNYVQQNIEGYDIWLAAYNPDNRPKLRDGKEWVFWQYTANGRVKGISTAVDRNVFDGSKRDFELKFRN
jgi:lysozyme